MKKNKKVFSLVLVFMSGIFLLSGCSFWTHNLNEMISTWKGRSVTIRTFADDAEMIDSISGKGVKIEADESFDIYTGNDTYAKGDVLKISVGKSIMHHVGSSLIASEDGLTELPIDFKNVNVESSENGTPFLEFIQADIANKFSGRKKLILIRSQSGVPLAVYAGDKVSMFAPGDIKKSTVLVVDGKYLFIHRCDYTIYDMEMIV